MPGKYIVKEDGKVVIERWMGEVTHGELVAYERRQLQDERIIPGAVCLSDCRKATFVGTDVENVHEISDVYGNTGNKTRLSKIALLLSADQLVRGQTLGGLAAEAGIEMIPFENLDAACVWLGISLKDAYDWLAAI